MKRRSKILTGLVAATMAFSTVCFGFSQWSSDITVNGSVSANGRWAVEITELGYDLSSGAAVTGVPAVEGEYLNLVQAGLLTSGVVSEDDFKAFIENNTRQLYTAANPNGHADDCSTRTGYWKVTDCEFITNNAYNDKLALRVTSECPDCGKRYIQTIAQTRWSDGTWRFAITNKLYVYQEGIPGIEEVEGPASNHAGVVSADGLTGTFASVNFTLPGAWVNYIITITNNGTADANLSEYAIVTELDNNDVYDVEKPDLENEVLKPGESCTFNVVVKLKDTGSTEIISESTPFSISLKYVQDEIASAPSAGHIHP